MKTTLSLCVGAFVLGSLPAAETAYQNDPLSHRIEKRVAGVRTKAWLWVDHLRPAAELDAANVLTARFIHADAANVPAYIVKGADTFRLIIDPRGSVRLVVDAKTGAIAQRLDYDEFGRVTRDTNPGFQPFGYAGGLYDPDTGLVRFGARDYDAHTARWTDQDPIRFVGGEENRYAYVGDDPVNGVDPHGLKGSRVKPATTQDLPLGSKPALGQNNGQPGIHGSAQESIGPDTQGACSIEERTRRKRKARADELQRQADEQIRRDREQSEWDFPSGLPKRWVGKSRVVGVQTIYSDSGRPEGSIIYYDDGSSDYSWVPHG